MKIGIIGSSGYIANHLIKVFEESNQIIRIGRNINDDIKIDLSNIGESELDKLNGLDYLLFAAAVSSPDICEHEFEEAWNINVVGTAQVIEYAISRKIRVLFFSSDAVYGDISGEIYTEASDCNPLTAYGKMKREVELRFSNNYFFKAIRLSYVVSLNDKFLKYCQGCAERGEYAEIYHPFYRSCTTLGDVTTVIDWLTHNWDVCKETILNVSGSELVSRLRIVDEYNRFSNNPKIRYVVNVPSDSFFEARPRITHVDCVIAKKYNILSNESFSEKMKRELEKQK